MKHIFLITLLFTLLTGCSTWEDKWFQKEWDKIDKLMDKEKKDRDKDGKLKSDKKRGTLRKADRSWGKSSAFDWHSNMDEIKEGGMKRIAQAQGGTKSDRSDAAVNKGGLQTFKKKPTTEKLKVSDGVSAWIEDFYKSNAPQFKGKSREERRDMALAAYLSAKKGD